MRKKKILIVWALSRVNVSGRASTRCSGKWGAGSDISERGRRKGGVAGWKDGRIERKDGG